MRRHALWKLLFAPVPGFGHWCVGRAARGLFCFMACAAGLNLVLMARITGPLAQVSPAAGWALAWAAVACSFLDVTRIVVREKDSVT